MDNLNKGEILEKIEEFLAGSKFCQIATINPEFILEAQKDEEFKNVLNNCDLNVADGVGISFAFRALGFSKLKTRIAGADLMNEILKKANDAKLSVFLATNKDGLSDWKSTAKVISKIYPDIIINGIDTDKKSVACQLPVAGYDIVFCNFGAPFQEKFLYSLKQKNYAKIRLAMGVGGSFDFWTGKQRRAPRWMRKLGLEWLFRLIQQPRRIGRIANAALLFPLKIILKK